MSSQDDGGRRSTVHTPHDAIRKDIIMGTVSGARSTRFQPRLSGNPKGRPKKVAPKTPSISEIPVLQATLDIAGRPMTITEAGRKTEVTMFQALVTNFAKQAFDGSPFASNKMIELIIEAQRREALDLEQQRALWKYYKESCAILDDEARSKGLQPPSHLPHPDDIIINSSGPVLFLGPLDDAGLRSMEQTLRFRDLMILQHGYDMRFAPRSKEQKSYLTYAAFQAQMFDRGLPPRLQLTFDQWFHRTWRAERLPKLQIMKKLYRGWRAEGANYRRGTFLPSLEWGIAVHKALVAYGNAVSKLKVDQLDGVRELEVPEVAAAVEQFQTALEAPRFPP